MRIILAGLALAIALFMPASAQAACSAEERIKIAKKFPKYTELWVKNLCAADKDKRRDRLLSEGEDRALNNKTEYFCLRYGNMGSNQTYLYAKEIDASPYSIDVILQNPACWPRKIGGAHTITIMQLTVEDVYSRKEHMEKMYNYIMKRHKNEQIFTDAVNAQNTDGMTVLDYIQFNLDNGEFSTADSKIQVGMIRDFVCTHGGIYVQYKDLRCD